MAVELRTLLDANQNIPGNVTKSEFHRYVEVQRGGAYNMLDPRAQELTGLSDKKYLTIIKFYKELKEIHGVPEE